MSDRPERAHGPSASATSASLIVRAGAQDPAAWSRMVTLYSPLIAHWCGRRGLSGEDVADVVQEVFRSVVRSLPGFRKHDARDTFRGWLRRITENKIHDHFRRLCKEPQGTGGTENGFRLQGFATHVKPGPTVGHTVGSTAGIPGDDAGDGASERGGTDQTARCQLLHRAMAGIREHFRENTWQAFLLTAVEGRPPKDVASELSMSPGAVRVAKSRVLQRLREELGDRA